MIPDEVIAQALVGLEVSTRSVAARLGCSWGKVARVRRGLGLPPYRRGRRPAWETWEEAFTARTVAVDGGHLHWTGRRNASGTPVLALRRQVRTAYRLAFHAVRGREPVGQARPACGYPGCVAGGHLEDRAMREVRRRAEGVAA